MEIGEFKKKYNITDEEIAKVVGVTKQSVRMWRRNKSKPFRTGNENKLLFIMDRLQESGIKKWYKGQAFDYLTEK